MAVGFLLGAAAGFVGARQQQQAANEQAKREAQQAQEEARQKRELALIQSQKEQNVAMVNKGIDPRTGLPFDPKDRAQWQAFELRMQDGLQSEE